MLRFASSSESNTSGTSTDRRYLTAAAALPSSSSSSSYGLVAGDINLSTIGSMSSFGQRRRQYSEDDDDNDGKVPAAGAAAAADAPRRDSNAEGHDLLPSPRRRALDSFVPLMSMASFDDHHPFFVDDDVHNTMNNEAQQANESRHRNASKDNNDMDHDHDHDDDTDGKPHKSTAGDRTDSTSGTRILTDGLPMPMADPDDESNGFSPTMCFVRQQLEFFLANAKDADARRKKGGVSGNVRPGSLGFRCIHCKALPTSQRAPSADAYPNQVQLIYQSVRNFQRHHFLKCPSVPKRLKEQYETMPRRQKSKRPVHKHTNPWVFSANRKGIADVPDDTCKGGYRISYSAPDPSADANTKAKATSVATAPEASAVTSTTAASSSSSSTSAAVSSSYYGIDLSDGIGVLPPTPIRVKEPERKKSRRS